MPFDILMPPLSQTSDTLLLLEWLKKPGDTLKKGEALFTVETDKASLEVEAPESGTLYEILAEPNTEVEIRTVIGRILKEGEQPAMPQKAPAAEPEPTAQPITEQISPQSTAAVQPPDHHQTRTFSSPRARRLAEQHGIDLTLAQASGPRGMIVEKDVAALIQKGKTAERIPQSAIRQVIAQRMLSSHLGSAPVTYMSEVDATDLVGTRQRMLARLAENQLRPTFTDFFIWIACQALKAHPQFNAVYQDDSLIVAEDIDLALAVDTERGLVVPVLRNAGSLNIEQITARRASLVERAQSGKLSADEMSVGTFTLTNLGSSGVDFFTPIINPPQVAILGIGRIREVPAVKDGGIFIRSVVGLALTCDHRVIDGAPAARFMQTLTHMIESPPEMH